MLDVESKKKNKLKLLFEMKGVNSVTIFLRKVKVTIFLRKVKVTIFLRKVKGANIPEEI